MEKFADFILKIVMILGLLLAALLYGTMCIIEENFFKFLLKEYGFQFRTRTYPLLYDLLVVIKVMLAIKVVKRIGLMIYKNFIDPNFDYSKYI